MQLDDENFESLVLKDDKHLWVVEFYADWCGHCKQFAKAYEKAATNLDGIVKFGACNTDACNAIKGVEIYAKTGSTAWSVDAIWKVQNPTFFLYNRISNVDIGSTGMYSFRNVPHFISLKESSKIGMDAEIQALLDSLYTHDNMAPFIAHRLIQHLVTSNPSPRYIRAVAVAFRDGDYEGIGSGKYGDLAAAVAAVLLDRRHRQGRRFVRALELRREDVRDLRPVAPLAQ